MSYVSRYKDFLSKVSKELLGVRGRMDRICESLKNQLAELDACIAAYSNAIEVRANRSNHEIFAFLIEKRKMVAQKLENIMCEMVHGW